jgi:Rps23 Pro-64 3,4-dihydroxylase Tpa1-like proline 4-hydroxylase
MIVNRHHIKSPSEVITTTLGIPEDYKQQCIQEAYKIGDKQGKKTNVKAIMSSYKVWEETDVYNPLFNKIMNAISMMGGEKLELYDAWTAIYKEGHYTISHNHGDVFRSFVYYLKTNNTTPLVFDGCEFQVQPHDDLLVVFPSHLIHSVPKHYGDDRICLAGNIKRVDK